MWPHLTLPPGSEGVHALKGTILGEFYFDDPDSGRRLTINNLWGKSPKYRFAVLRNLFGYETFGVDVLEKISKLTYRECKRVIFLYRSIETGLLVSTPSLGGLKPIPKFIWKLWKWVWCSSAYNMRSVATQWKQFVLHLRHKVAKSDNLGENPIPSSFPGVFKGSIGWQWTSLCPWMTELCMLGAPSRELVRKVGILAQHRHMPGPTLTESRMREELDTFMSHLRLKDEVDSVMLRRIEEAAEGIGEYCRQTGEGPVDYPHLSLSTSGCFNREAAEGGRVIDAMLRWLYHYVAVLPEVDRSGITWFEGLYEERRDHPRYMTMCRDVFLEKDVQFMDSAFRDSLASNTVENVCFLQPVGSQLPIEEPVFGLDEVFPSQILQWSIEELIDHGYLDGLPRFKAKRGKTALPEFGEAKPIESRAHLVDEPGDKVRWVTMEESFVTVFLQPFQHTLAGLLGKFPSLISAFSRSSKGHDFVDSLSRRPEDAPKQDGIGTFDLTAATNVLKRSTAKSALKGFLRGANLSSDYIDLCCSIIFRDRRVHVYKDSGRERKEICFISTNGLLMGNPVTKELLCLVSACIQLITTVDMKLKHPPYCLIAGDDVALYCCKRFFRHCIWLNQRAGNIINESKTLYSHLCNFFCEETLFLVNEKVHNGKSLSQMFRTVGETTHVDTIKLRYLSPFGKQDKETYKNPMIGKGKALKKQLGWFPIRPMADMAKARFLFMMGHLYDIDDPIIYLPPCMGGYDAITNKSKEEICRLIFQTDIPLSQVYRATNDLSNCSSWVDDLLKRMACGGSARGLIDPLLNYGVDQYCTVVRDFTFPEQVRTYSELQNDLFEKKKIKKSDQSFTMVQRYARSMGLVGKLDLAHSIDRVTNIRIAICVAAGVLPLEDYIVVNDNHRGPMSVFREALENESIHIPADTLECIQPRNGDDEAFRQWLLGGRKPFWRAANSMFFPRRSVKDSLNGMRVSLTGELYGSQKGSVEDEGFAPQDGYELSFVSTNRLRSIRCS